MKTLTTHITALCAALLLTACTHNGGDIGIWFGTWHVEEIVVDGVVDAYYDQAPIWFFQFQSTVVQLRLVLDDHSFDASTGTWDETDGHLTITFPDEVYLRQVPPGITATTVMNIDRKSASTVILSFTGTDGHAYRYTLKHWG